MRFFLSDWGFGLLLVLEVLALDKVGDVIVIGVVLLVVIALLLLKALVALCELSQRRERVGAKLVKDTGDELGQLLVLAVSVDGEGVGRDRRVNCTHTDQSVRSSSDHYSSPTWIAQTNPWERRSG